MVGVDPLSHMLQLVNPSGGQIQTAAMTTQEGQEAMKKINIGDIITAVVSETVEPAT